MTGADPARKEEAYRKRMKAAELRRMGKKWEDVAAESGYHDRAGAFNAVKLLLKEHQSLAYDEIALYRQESIDRLTMLLEAALPRALKGDEKMMREARLIISQIDDLTGAKAPVKVEIGESDVDRAIRELEAELNERSAAIAREAAQASGAPGSTDPGQPD
jgi:hypothetical protein